MPAKPLFAFAVFSLAAVTAAPVTAADALERLVGPARAATLRAAPMQDGIVEAQLRAPAARLVPDHPEVRRAVTEAKAGLSPSLLVEGLFLYRKPAAVTAWSLAEQTDLFRRLTALSTLTGIEYFSASAGAMRTLYETSRVIDNPRSRTPLADPVIAVLPATLALYARQRDLTFGDNTYRFDYRTGADFIVFSQENLTAMTVGIVPVIGRNRFVMIMAVVDTGDGLLIYTAAMARAAVLPGMGDRIGTSFTNRLRAILRWFSVHADAVFG